MDKFITTDNGGTPHVLDDFRWFMGQESGSEAIYQFLNDLFGDISDNIILSGCDVSGSSVTAGWIVLDGEVLKVDAHTKSDDYFVKVTTYDSSGDKTQQSGATAQTYQKNRATLTASSGNLIYTGEKLIQDLWISETSLDNSWIGAVYYLRDMLGFIHLRGLASSAGGASAGNSIFTLPSGYRPVSDSYFQVASASTSSSYTGKLIINTSGEIIPQTTINQTSNAVWSLDGVTFRKA